MSSGQTGYDLSIPMFNLLEKGNLMKKFIGLMLTGAVIVAVILSGAINKDGGGPPISEPAAMFLLGLGLIGLAGYGRKQLFRK